MYVGSSNNLFKRLKTYYTINYLEINKSMYIYNALRNYGYLAFSFSIFEYLDLSNLSKDGAKILILGQEQYFLDLLNPDFNILKFAGNSLGFEHSEELLAKISEAKIGEKSYVW